MISNLEFESQQKKGVRETFEILLKKQANSWPGSQSIRSPVQQLRRRSKRHEKAIRKGD